MNTSCVRCGSYTAGTWMCGSCASVSVKRVKSTPMPKQPESSDSPVRKCDRCGDRITGSVFHADGARLCQPCFAAFTACAGRYDRDCGFYAAHGKHHSACCPLGRYVYGGRHTSAPPPEPPKPEPPALLGAAVVDDEPTCCKKTNGKRCGKPWARRITAPQCACGSKPGGWLCQDHAGEDTAGWTCTSCSRKVHLTTLDAHESAIARFQQTGHLAHLDAVTSLVTLDYPADWDVYGSLLKPDPPVAAPVRRQRHAPFPFAVAAPVLPILAALYFATLVFTDVGTMHKVAAALSAIIQLVVLGWMAGWRPGKED